MPTMTRLAAMLVFAVIAVQLGWYHGTLFEPALESTRYVLILVFVGAYVGWSYVGKRIDGQSFAAMGVGMQAMVLGILFAVLLGAAAQSYTRHMRFPYRDFEHLGAALVETITEHFLMMLTPVFGISVILSGFLGGLACAAVHRIAERRRMQG